MAGAGKQSALLVDVEFAALNRWHITRWHLESSAAGQLSHASAVVRRRRSFLGWRWAFPGSRVFAFLRCSPLLGSVLFQVENKPSSLLTFSIMAYLSNRVVLRGAESRSNAAFSCQPKQPRLYRKEVLMAHLLLVSFRCSYVLCITLSQPCVIHPGVHWFSS